MSQPTYPANADSVPYWEGARQHKLMFQRCTACGVTQFPPRHHCGSCWEGELEWIESSGRGKVESFTIVRRAPVPAYRDKVPYVIAAVVVEEGVRMITNVPGDDALDLKIGDIVTVDFAENADGLVLPAFRRSA